MTTTNKIINSYLGGKRISKDDYNDFRIVVDEIGGSKRVLDWFSYLHSIETFGWRPKPMTQKIARFLKNNSKDNKLLLFALFCPSYKKGDGACGFRIDDIGSTTKWGINVLKQIYAKTCDFGFYCKPPLAIFFDLAVEQAEKVIETGEIENLKKNISNFKKNLADGLKFLTLSGVDKNLFNQIGYKGIVKDPLPIPDDTFERIVERGEKFYELFGWSKEQIIERSKIIATSEAFIGSLLKKKYPDGILVYTPTMLERAVVYSGMEYKTNPLPVIFPKHDREKG